MTPSRRLAIAVLFVGSACGGPAASDRGATVTPSATEPTTEDRSFVLESRENGRVLRHAALGVEVPLPEGFAPVSRRATSDLDVFLTHGENHTHHEVEAYSRDDGAALVVLLSSPIPSEVATVAAFGRAMRPPEGANAAVPVHIVVGFGTEAEVRQRVVSGGIAADMRAFFVEAGGQSYPFEVVVVGGLDDERAAVLDGIQRDPVLTSAH